MLDRAGLLQHQFGELWGRSIVLMAATVVLSQQQGMLVISLLGCYG